MQGNKERWEQLCEQAAVEQDAEKLAALVYEINMLLLERQVWIKARKKPDGQS